MSKREDLIQNLLACIGVSIDEQNVDLVETLLAPEVALRDIEALKRG